MLKVAHKVMLDLLKVHDLTMHTVPLYVVGGMVCAVCALTGQFEQRANFPSRNHLAAKGSDARETARVFGALA